VHKDNVSSPNLSHGTSPEVLSLSPLHVWLEKIGISLMCRMLYLGDGADLQKNKTAATNIVMIN